MGAVFDLPIYMNVLALASPSGATAVGWASERRTRDPFVQSSLGYSGATG